MHVFKTRRHRPHNAPLCRATSSGFRHPAHEASDRLSQRRFGAARQQSPRTSSLLSVSIIGFRCSWPSILSSFCSCRSVSLCSASSEFSSSTLASSCAQCEEGLSAQQGLRCARTGGSMLTALRAASDMPWASLNAARSSRFPSYASRRYAQRCPSPGS